jgi:hypothetical protein
VESHLRPWHSSHASSLDSCVILQFAPRMIIPGIKVLVYFMESCADTRLDGWIIEFCSCLHKYWTSHLLFIIVVVMAGYGSCFYGSPPCASLRSANREKNPNGAQAP